MQVYKDLSKDVLSLLLALNPEVEVLDPRVILGLIASLFSQILVL